MTVLADVRWCRIGIAPRPADEAIPAEDQPMTGEYFWQCLESLAAALDGDRQRTDEHLNLYEQQYLQFSPEKRTAAKRQIIRIIGGLARLETRLLARDQP